MVTPGTLAGSWRNLQQWKFLPLRPTSLVTWSAAANSDPMPSMLRQGPVLPATGDCISAGP